jgi:two-component system, NarL family, response regulator YdfI
VTRVLVASSTAVVRAGLEAILSREPGFVLVGGSGSPRSLGDDVTEHEPDVVLLDVAGPDTEELFAALPMLSVDADEGSRATPAIVLLSDEREVGRLADALHAGVRALLPRDATPNEILAATGAAAAGLVTITADWLDVLAPQRAASARARMPVGTREAALSSRELEVLRLIADGLANKQIAARLGISEHTVKFHVASLFAKLHASTRAEAVMSGARRGMIVV